jgi:hypothetical protein
LTAKGSDVMHHQRHTSALWDGHLQIDRTSNGGGGKDAGNNITKSLQLGGFFAPPNDDIWNHHVAIKHNYQAAAPTAARLL